MEQQVLDRLTAKINDGTATEEELALFSAYMDRLAYGEEDFTAEYPGGEDALKAEIWQAIDPARQAVIVPLKRRWIRYGSVAAVVAGLAIGGYAVFHQKASKPQFAVVKPNTFKNDALPGNKAILTLANGKQVAISTLPAGKIAQSNAQKTTGGALIYQQATAAEDVYNTLTVPRGGGKHELYLADGTLVVLDVASSIRFPVAFNGPTRKVYITGQAYLEVKHDDHKAFFVQAGDQLIQDLGTHLNINTFDAATTLVEGSIRVNNTALQPGEQIMKDQVTQANLEEVLAWKNDQFLFGKNTTLQAVMEQLGRWYDMDIVYEGSSKTYHFGGGMSRNTKLSNVLKILAISGVQFSVDGKKIIVYQ